MIGFKHESEVPTLEHGLLIMEAWGRWPVLMENAKKFEVEMGKTILM